MNTLIELLPVAELDILEAFQWYEDRSKGLGLDFLRSVDVAISNIQRNPEAYPIIYKNIRRLLLRKFPYGLFYFIEGNKIIVIACFHFRRDPSSLLKRD